MIIDMHLHIMRRSDCSDLSIEHICNSLSPKIDAICITDHDTISPIPGLEEMGLDFKVLYGAELTFQLGDVLVYGVDASFARYFPKIYDLHTMIQKVHEAGGIVAFAHPLRTIEIEKQAYAFDFDAIEINGSETKHDNRFASRIAEVMDLPTIGGSDAHHPLHLNTFATKFDTPVETIGDLVSLVKEKKCKAVRI